MAEEVKVERSSRRLSLEEIANSTTHGVGLTACGEDVKKYYSKFDVAVVVELVQSTVS